MKSNSLKNLITHFKSSIFSVQETHYRKKGRFTHENFAIFEAIRKKEGGGSMLGVHVSLKPVLITEHSDNFELIVVQISVAEKEIRIITGYGPQESWDLDVKMQFFVALEEETAKAAFKGISVIIMGDLNSKLGPTFIKNDPNSMSENGTILAGIMERHELIVVNGLKEKCKGLITRQRHTVNSEEKSIIDFVIVTKDIVEDIVGMVIDDERKHVLTKLVKRKKGLVKIESDHNTIVTELKLKRKPHKSRKREIYNLKNAECQKTFTKEMNHTEEL